MPHRLPDPLPNFFTFLSFIVSNINPSFIITTCPKATTKLPKLSNLSKTSKKHIKATPNPPIKNFFPSNPIKKLSQCQKHSWIFRQVEGEAENLRKFHNKKWKTLCGPCHIDLIYRIVIKYEY